MALLWDWQEHPPFMPEEISIWNGSRIVVLGNGIPDAHASLSVVSFLVCDRRTKSGVIQECACPTNGELVSVAIPSRAFIHVMQKQNGRAGVRTYALQDQKQLGHLTVIRLVARMSPAQGIDNDEADPLCTEPQPISVSVVLQIEWNAQHGQNLDLFREEFPLPRGQMTTDGIQPSAENDFRILQRDVKRSARMVVTEAQQIDPGYACCELQRKERLTDSAGSVKASNCASQKSGNDEVQCGRLGLECRHDLQGSDLAVHAALPLPRMAMRGRPRAGWDWIAFACKGVLEKAGCHSPRSICSTSESGKRGPTGS